MNGIDISRYQGTINFEQVNKTQEFVIIRAGYGKENSQIDALFESNYTMAKKAGIPVGCYWYSYAVTEEEAEQEAKVFLETIKGKQFDFPVYYDVEENRTLNLGKSMVSKIIRKFLTTVESAGYFVGLYMSSSPLTDFVEDDIKKRYTIWVAHYGVSKPSYTGNYGIWQKSSSGTVNGISGNVDIDEAYQNFPAIIKEAGLNGFKIDKEIEISAIDCKWKIKQSEFDKLVSTNIINRG